MSRRFFTADLHLGHANVIRYCARPYRDAEHMQKSLVANINSRVKEDDVLVHVGDFCTRGFAKGEEGSRLKARDYLKLINAPVVMVLGNHDRQNKTKTVCEYMFCDVGPQRAFVTHYPTTAPHMPPALMDFVRSTCQFAVTGHVHEKWLYQWDGHGLLNVNVGVDQWKYMPVSDDELLVAVNKIKRQKL